MVAEYDKDVFRLALLNEDASPQPPIPLGSCDQEQLGRYGGGLIGLGLAVAALLIAVALLVWFFRRRQKIRDSQVQTELARIQATSAENHRQHETQLDGVRRQLREVSRPELATTIVNQAQHPEGGNGDDGGRAGPFHGLELQGSNAENPQSPGEPQQAFTP